MPSSVVPVLALSDSPAMPLRILLLLVLLVPVLVASSEDLGPPWCWNEEYVGEDGITTGR